MYSACIKANIHVNILSLAVEMAEIIREEWFWIIVMSLAAILILPLLLVWLILMLPGELRLTLTILLIIGWGIVAGYKDWLLERRKGEKAGS